MNMETKEKNKIDVTVSGQEGDTKSIEINIHQHLKQLLHEGLIALYGKPSPDPEKYDLVFKGKILSELNQTIEQAGIHRGDEVSILPKEISRG